MQLDLAARKPTFHGLQMTFHEHIEGWSGGEAEYCEGGSANEVDDIMISLVHRCYNQQATDHVNKSAYLQSIACTEEN